MSRPMGVGLGTILDRDHANTSPLFRTDDRVTSITAAPTGASRRNGCNRALAAFAAHGPMTDFELAHVTSTPQTSIGKRRLDLERNDPPLVEDAGFKRRSPSGAWVQVSRLTVAGRDAARALGATVTVAPEHTPPARKPATASFVRVGFTLPNGHTITEAT
jgi:hypothetical protein